MPANLVHRLAISTEFSFYIDIHKDHDSCWYTTVTNNSRSPSHSYTYCIWADRWNGRHEPVTIQSNLQFSAYEQTQNLCKHLLIKPRSLSIIHCITQMHTITFCGLIMIIFCHIHLYLQSRSQDNDFFIQILRILKIFNNLQFFFEFQQEGWLSPTESVSVSAIGLTHNLATSGESCRHVIAFTRFAGGGMWLPQESLRHILAAPGYANGTIAVDVTAPIWNSLPADIRACSLYSSFTRHLKTFYFNTCLLYTSPSPRD